METANKSRVEEIADQLFFWRKWDSSFASVNFLDRVNVAVLQAIEEKATHYFPDDVRPLLDRYLEIRGISYSPDASLIQELGKQGGMRVFQVRSLEDEKAGMNGGYRVKIGNLLSNPYTADEKLLSFKMAEVSCTCDHFHRFAGKWTGAFKNLINEESNILTAPICKHILRAYDYSAVYHNTFDWSDDQDNAYLGLSKHVAREISPVIKSIVRHKEDSQPNYRLNAEYKTEAMRTFKPLEYLKALKV